MGLEISQTNGFWRFTVLGLLDFFIGIGSVKCCSLQILNKSGFRHPGTYPKKTGGFFGYVPEKFANSLVKKFRSIGRTRN